MCMQVRNVRIYTWQIISIIVHSNEFMDENDIAD